jgi:hypothetical protein
VSEHEVNETGFVFPKLDCGQNVEVAWNIGFSKRRLGKVSQPKSNSCSIEVMTEDGTRMYRDCRHRDDPRLLSNPEWLAEDPGNRAIFDISEVEHRRMRSDQTLARAMGMLDDMAADIVRLKEACGLKDIPKPKVEPVVVEKKPEIAEMVRRGPGRPRLEPVGVQ